MKKIISILALLIPILIFAQVPQGISYQAIALNGSGNPVVSSNVGIRLSVLDNSTSGTVLYSETQTKTTNAQGLFNLVIGQGTPSTGTFGTINWNINTKFLKVELDIAGGTNYVLVGSTQLLSVPYALAADSLVTSPGEGITLVSPNGTPYQVTVNDSGQLSLPTSNSSSTAPTQLFLYGSFNGWDAATSLQFDYNGTVFTGYKYITGGTQIKFLAAQNTNVIYGGNSLNGTLISNGNAINVNSSGFYKITVNPVSGIYTITSINVQLYNNTMSYNVPGNYFSATWNVGMSFGFQIGSIEYGDNLGDYSLEINGASISPPTSGPNYYKLFINFNGAATYTVTN
ncbi:hypothetical protein [Flavobacterium sp.]|uniref:hypothetical protein n=1 Tax=Flavobacterium sp. TaxID=239 RepID=UPI00286AC3F1|nr:hypothetical protein [Flavobacterium sp.]